MNWLIIKNDFKRNKVINLALILFLMFSAGLAVLSVFVGAQTFTSIKDLYKTAQPPHFLQMHKGEINQGQLDKFLSGYRGVTCWQAGIMLDVYGKNIIVAGKKDTYDLSGCRLDIGLVKQNDTKDLLLNSGHEKVILHQGEVGIPVLLKEMYGLNTGDRIIITDNGISKEFVISEFILDSMMNSSMCSSARILLSDQDFNELAGQVGEKEYLIEVYFNNSKKAADFQTAYENAGLPQNGQAVTYSMIFLLSALTDILTVFVLLLASILLIAISFICVRFTIMAALEEELGEIGTMKAIGFPFSDIRDIFLSKYRVLAMTGVTAGAVLAFLINGVFTKHIGTTFGRIRMSVLAVVLAAAAGLLVFLLINHYCKRILKKIKKVTAVDALVSGKGFEREDRGIRDGLYKSKHLCVNWLLGIREVFYKFKKWIIVFSVILITVLMLLVPVNLMNTLEAPEFITYMGSSPEDILIEVDNGESLEAGYINVKHILENDGEVKNYYEYKRVRVRTADVSGGPLNLNIDCGNNAGNGLKYLSGKAPEAENEIAISCLNAKETGRNSGDTIMLFINGREQYFVISGIYQDVTGGGFSAKTKNSFTELKAEKYSFSVDLKDNTKARITADAWSEQLGGGVTVEPMKEFIDQTLGGVVRQLRMIILTIAVLGACLAMLICVLFLKLRLAKDLSEIAVLKAIGFSEKDIKRQYTVKTSCVSLAGILAGIILTNILGDSIVNAALNIAGLGIRRVELIIGPVTVYLLYPLLLLGLMLAVTRLVLGTIRKYNIISVINE